MGPYKSALIAALRHLLRPGRRNRKAAIEKKYFLILVYCAFFYCGNHLRIWLESNQSITAIEKGTIKRLLLRRRRNRGRRSAAIDEYCRLLRLFYCGAATAGRSGCRSTPNWVPKQSFCAATEASLYDPV